MSLCKLTKPKRNHIDAEILWGAQQKNWLNNSTQKKLFRFQVWKHLCMVFIPTEHTWKSYNLQLVVVETMQWNIVLKKNVCTIEPAVKTITSMHSPISFYLSADFPSWKEVGSETLSLDVRIFIQYHIKVLKKLWTLKTSSGGRDSTGSTYKHRE